jgi:hypothetical protein
LLGVLLARVGREVVQVARQAEPLYIALGFLTALAGVATGAWKWQLMLGRLGVRIRFRSALRLYWIGLFYSNFLPTTIGGDVVRVLVSRAELGGKTMELTASTIGERATGLLALLILASAALAAVSVPGLLFSTRMWFAIGGLTLAAMTAWLLLRPDVLHLRIGGEGWAARALRQLGRLRRTLADCTRGRGWFAAIMAISIVRQGQLALMIWVLATGIHLSIPAGLFFVLVPVACLIWMIPISVSGIGVREWSFVLLFGPFGVTRPRAVTLSLLTWAMVVLSTCIGGLLQPAKGSPPQRSEVSEAPMG